ncbi:MAG TPA: hypothetical protein DCM50_12425 [Stenotrophomonas sp.]|nr:hypothetical protein [Stenotrophomonas sp.]
MLLVLVMDRCRCVVLSWKAVTPTLGTSAFADRYVAQVGLIRAEPENHSGALDLERPVGMAVGCVRMRRMQDRSRPGHIVHQ